MLIYLIENYLNGVRMVGETNQTKPMTYRPKPIKS